MNRIGGSYWHRDVQWRDRWVGTALPAVVDFAVIGGGFAGLSTALALRRLDRGASIALLEAERIGYGASGRNAGFLSPVAAPAWLLGGETSEQRWATGCLHSKTVGVATWIKEHAPGAELAPATLGIQASGFFTDVGLEEFSVRLERAGLGMRLVGKDRRRCVEMEAHTLHPYKLALELAERAEAASISIAERTRVKRLEPEADGVRIHVGSSGPNLLASKVIVCTNAYTGALDLGERVHAAGVHSFMIASDRHREPRWNRDHDFTVELDEGHAYHRLHRGRVLFGGIDQLRRPNGSSFTIPKRVRSRLESMMSAKHPGTKTALAWGGAFHATPTGLPIIRPTRRSSRVILNVGYGGTGVALSLTLSGLAASLAAETEVADSEDARLRNAIAKTRIPIGGSLRALSRIARRFVCPWL